MWDLIKDEVYSIDKVKWMATVEKVATCLYNYHRGGMYNGAFVQGSRKATNIFIKVNGDWKIIHVHLNPNNKGEE
jgi:hypothetical protein